MELLRPWPMGGRWGTREIVAVRKEREYRLTFYAQRTLDGVTPSDAAARETFETFLRTFTFIPVAATAMRVRPTLTRVPTPLASPADGSSDTLYRGLRSVLPEPLAQACADEG